MLDPDNAVVRLCVRGMELEGKGDQASAAEAFIQAWNLSTTDLERCIAAHYVARHQNSSLDELEWNGRALDYADRVAGDEIREFYPSLYLNMGNSHENAGNKAEARRFYVLASEVLDDLPEGRYGGLTRGAVERALVRVHES